jgi:stress-induced morphogen
MVVESKIREKLQREFNPSVLELGNESVRHHRKPGSETHFKLLMVSSLFEGVSRLKRQQKVHDALAEELSGPVHAFTMKLLTEEEWRALPEEERKFKAVGHHPSAGKMPR